MKNAALKLVVLVVFALAAACGSDGGSNNGTTSNNGTSNNASADAGGNDATTGGGDAGQQGDTGGGGSGSQGLTLSGQTCDSMDFTACGGDLVGTWALDGGCVTPTELPQHPDCSGATIDVSINPSGDITLVDDGSYTVNSMNFDTTLDATVPKSCLASGETCTDNGIDQEGTDNGDSCQLSYGHDVWIRNPGSYTVDDSTNKVELTPESGFGTRSFEYCVDGDTLTLHRLDGQYHDAYLTLARQ